MVHENVNRIQKRGLTLEIISGVLLRPMDQFLAVPKHKYMVPVLNYLKTTQERGLAIASSIAVSVYRTKD